MSRRIIFDISCAENIDYDIIQVVTGRKAAFPEKSGMSCKKEGRNMNIIDTLEQEQLKKDITEFSVGDTVKVYVKVVEGTRERLQAFEGTVIQRNGGSVRETFTVRRVSYGVGVERTFPLHSPRVAQIEVLHRGRVRRAKLFYLRNRVGKAAKVREIQGNK